MAVINPCASTPCADNCNCTAAMGPSNYSCQCAMDDTSTTVGTACLDDINDCATTTHPNNIAGLRHCQQITCINDNCSIIRLHA